MFTGKEFFERNMEFQKEMIDAYQKNAKEFFKMLDPSKMMKSIPYSPDFISKMFFSTESYDSLYELWSKMMSDYPIDDPEKIKNYITSAQKLSIDTIKEILKPIIPEQYADMWQDYDKLSEKYVSSITSFFKPWIDDTAKLNDCIGRIAKGDFEALSEYISMISEAYDKSYGRVLNVAGVGYAREVSEEFSKGIDSYIKFMISYFEFMVSIVKISRDASQEIIEKFIKTMKESDDPMVFKDFYTMWLRTNANVFEELFRSEGFAKMTGELTSRAYKLKMKSDELMERYISMFPVPTNKEMKGLYRTVYDLRKENKAIKEELKEIKKQLSEISKNISAGR